MKLLKYQHWHLLSLLVLLSVVYFFVGIDRSFLKGELSGIKTATWLFIAIIVPVAHQCYVLVCWRLELFYKGLSKTFGDNAFKLFKVGFAILFLSRLISIIVVAISNSGTLRMNNIMAYILAFIVFIPAAYLFYSVKKYFGIDKAFGLDHFRPDEFKNKPFIKKGIFKYTSNGMYIYGFFILWIPGLVLLSKVALLVALFNHIYIWVHYCFTELPDIKIIYGD